MVYAFLRIGSAANVFISTTISSNEYTLESVHIAKLLLHLCLIRKRAGLSGPTTFTNSATITSAIVDPMGDNNNDSVFTSVEFEADLAIAKTSIRSDEGAITYSIVITNLVPNLAHGAVVSDVILPGIFSDDDWTWQCSSNGASCNAGNGTGSLFEVIPGFPSGGVVSYTITATLAEPSIAAVINTATISPPVTVNDPVTANNTTTDINELLVDDIYLPILFKK